MAKSRLTNIPRNSLQTVLTPSNGARRWIMATAALVWAVLVASCAPTTQGVVAGDPVGPRWSADQFIARDGVGLPLVTWAPSEGPARAVFVAVHGFNDYHRAFALAGPHWAQRGIVVYAYDQRGFGAAPGRGVWPGSNLLTRDLQDLLLLARERHPQLPIYVLGDSMGAAVVMATLRESTTPLVEGVILNAPAVWGRDSFNPLYRMVLWAAAHTVPWWEVTGGGLRIRVTDNRDWLRELSRDPLMIRETRIDALYGVVDLMDQALAEPPRAQVPTLVLYGLRDEVIPRTAVCRFAETLPDSHRVLWYPEGYHMLLRDLQAGKVWQDVEAWVGGAADGFNGQLSREAACTKATGVTEAAGGQGQG